MLTSERSRAQQHLWQAAGRSGGHAATAYRGDDTDGMAAALRALEARKALLAGAVAALAAPDEQAAELFDAALADPGARWWPFDLARVHLTYGERLRRDRTARVQLGSRRQGAGYDSSGSQLTDRRWIYDYDAWAEAAALT